jgi:hypothetical protein
MDPRELQRVLKAVEQGDLSVGEAAEVLQRLPFSDVGWAKVDLDRRRRCGFPEAIFCQGKGPEQVRAIARRMLANGVDVLATRATEAVYDAVRAIAEDAVWTPLARTVTVTRRPRRAPVGEIVVVCAGTADLPVAEEARVTAEFLDNRVHAVRDVGVAGIHRLLHHAPRLRRARAIVVVAGMEGALPSVVSGIVACPVIAVPTSIGYGASFQGLAPLLTMLNSCAAGVAVVNIDNGFGAACVASLINHTGEGQGDDGSDA